MNSATATAFDVDTGNSPFAGSTRPTNAVRSVLGTPKACAVLRIPPRDNVPGEGSGLDRGQDGVEDAFGGLVVGSLPILTVWH